MENRAAQESIDRFKMNIKEILFKIIRMKRVQWGAGAVAFLLLFILGVKIYFIARFPEHGIREFMSEFMLDNFRKAIKFDDVSISCTGTIGFQNFHVSNSSDFNDNISLIKSRNVEVRLDFLKALRGKAVIRGIYFDSPEISIYKKLGRPYLETFREIFSLSKPIKDIQQIDADNFYIEFDDSQLTYKEVFQEEVLEIDCESVNSTIRLSGNRVSYLLEGIVNKHKSRIFDRGRISLKGAMVLKDFNSITESSSEIELSGFDLSLLNIPAADYYQTCYAIEGGLDTRLVINSSGESASVSGRLELDNVNVRCNQGAQSYNVVSNENLNSEFLVDFLGGKSRIIVKKLRFYDDNINLNIRGTVAENEYEHYFDGTFDTNSIDLSSVSGTFTPTRDTTYAGRLSADGRVWYDLKNNLARNVYFRLALRDFQLFRSTGSSSESLVRDMNGLLTLKDGVLNGGITFRKKDSDVNFSIESRIAEWNPLKTSSAVKIRSRSLDVRYLYHPVRELIGYFFDGAYHEKTLNYDIGAFKDEPVGMLINNNRIVCDVKIDRIDCGRGAAFRDLSFIAGLEAGHMYLKDLSAVGYDGKYSLSYDGYFDWYAPKITVSGGVKDFDLGKFTRDIGITGGAEGILGVDFRYDVSASNFSQIFTNSILDFTVTLKPAVLKDTAIQKNLASFFEQGGVPAVDIGMLAVTEAEFSFIQRADNFMAKKIYINSDGMSFFAQGKYDYEEGFSVPVSATVRIKSADGTFKTEKAALVLKGGLLNPYLVYEKSLKEKNGKEPRLSLFNVN